MKRQDMWIVPSVIIAPWKQGCREPSGRQHTVRKGWPNVLINVNIAAIGSLMESIRYRSRHGLHPAVAAEADLVAEVLVAEAEVSVAAHPVAAALADGGN